jgi:predicted RNA binding protein YcfA (HicA-like mRNA interferase family)
MRIRARVRSRQPARVMATLKWFLIRQRISVRVFKRKHRARRRTVTRSSVALLVFLLLRQLQLSYPMRSNAVQRTYMRKRIRAIVAVFKRLRYRHRRFAL